MMQRPKILFFDVMSTLVYDPFFVEVPAHFKMTLRELLANKDKNAWPAFERNEITEEQFFKVFFGDGRFIDGAAMKSCMLANYRFLDGIEDLLAELLADGIKMHSLSNYPIWYQLIEEKLNLERFMDWQFVSCRTGIRKPDPRAYLGPANSLGVAPEECLFIDDRADNCAAATAVGMPAIQYRNTPDLRDSLIAFGALL